MNRRAFLGSLIGGVVAASAVRTFPFRVFSFPSEIITGNRLLTTDWITAESLRILVKQLNLLNIYNEDFEQDSSKIGSIINVKMPQRFILQDSPFSN